MEKTIIKFEGWVNKECKKSIQDIPASVLKMAKESEIIFGGLLDRINLKTGINRNRAKEFLTEYLNK